MTASIDRTSPATLPDAHAMGYSQISSCLPGTMLFISGQVSWTPEGSTPPESLQEQTRLAMSNVIKALESKNATAANITSMRMYLVNPTQADFYSAAPIIREFLGEILPTFTALGVTALGGEGLRVEIEVTAVV